MQKNSYWDKENRIINLTWRRVMREEKNLEKLHEGGVHLWNESDIEEQCWHIPGTGTMMSMVKEYGTYTNIAYYK